MGQWGYARDSWKDSLTTEVAKQICRLTWGFKPGQNQLKEVVHYG
jgi:hypothetical protein